MDAHAFLKALAIVLCTAGVTTVLFQWLRQPVVLGYVLAGLIVGPHLPVPLVADPEIVQVLSELGVILLMFSLGLEFSLSKLARLGPTAGLTALIQSSLMVWLGFAAGRAFGWTVLESLFAGAIVAISSTTIIAKAFDEQKIGGRLRELVVGILIVEDLIAILLMAILTALASGQGLSASTLFWSSGKLLLFLGGLTVVGLLVVPRLVRAIDRLDRPETTLVASIGICFAIALLAHELGYSVALGAFIAGSLVAESGRAEKVEHLVLPVRDLFAAIFFVSVGMQIDPELIAEHWPAIAVLTVLVVAGKVVGVSAGAFLTGNGVRTSVQAGMSLAQIGEFSFIIAGLGISLGATGEFLYPIAVAVSAVTTLTTPWLIRAAGPVARYADRKLPRRLQTFAALYGSWVEQLRTAPGARTAGATTRRLVRLLLLDVLLLGGVMIGAALGLESLTAQLSSASGLSTALARGLVLLAAVLLAVPFAIGIFRIAGRLGASLAEAALPKAHEKGFDPAAAPRRALVVTLQLTVVLTAGVLLLALAQPFLPVWPVATALALLLLPLAVLFWRSATNLQGHVRAGAGMIAEALAAHARKEADDPADRSLAQVNQLLPGIGEPVALRLGADSGCVGKTLAELEVRGLTGATVLAIQRGKDGVIIPRASEVLRAGDVLAVAGTHEAVAAATELLESGGDVRARGRE